MAGFPPISVRQPLPFDLVDSPIDVSGVATAFEGVLQARIRDFTGLELAQTQFLAGGTGIWGNFHISFGGGGIFPTIHGILEVYAISPADGSEMGKVIVPITFGPAILDPYHGFAQHTVAAGESLSVIAQQWYGDALLWDRIYEANRNQIIDPNLIFPGQVLRVPQ
jgi:nucleoid-associated protein YgaU